MNVNLNLPIDDVVAILNALAELPYKKVTSLITKITSQVDEQEKAQRTASEKKDVPAEVQ